MCWAQKSAFYAWRSAKNAKIGNIILQKCYSRYSLNNFYLSQDKYQPSYIAKDITCSIL